MQTKTQLAFVLERLQENGQVSRNDCLKHFITRLGSRIWDLKQEGFDFDIKRIDGDYIYVLKASPAPRQLQLV